MFYLRRVNGHYYFRVRVPKDLQSLFQVKEIKSSLHTKNFKNAKVSAKAFSYKLERIITLARSGMLTTEEIRGMMREFVEKELKRLDNERLLGIGVPKKPKAYSADLFARRDEVGLLVKHYAEKMKELQADIAYHNFRPYQEAVDELLQRNSIRLEKDSIEYNRFCREYIRGLIKINRVERERAKGDYDNEYDKSRSRKAVYSPLGVTDDVGELKEKQPVMKLSNVIELYVKEKADNWAYKTRLENEHIFKVALEIIGDRDVRTLTRPDFLSYRDALKALPPNYSKKKEYQGKTLLQIIRMAKRNGIEGISEKTRNKNLQGVSTSMEWCVEQDFISKNYAKNLASKGKQKPEDKRKPYSVADLRKVIQSPVYTTDIPVKRPERFWVPLIALFSGCRLNEICSLYVRDVGKEDGIHYFDINYDGDDKHVKTESSARKVPIHPTLIKIGLLDYVEKLKREKEQRLFPKLTYTKANGYGGAFGKWWSRYSKEEAAINDKKKVFHSFRRTVADTLKQQGVDYKQIEEILGHKDNSMSTGYYAEAFKPKVLLAALKRLDDYGFDFAGVRFPIKLIDK